MEDVAAGDGFSLMISGKGELFSCGHNAYHGHKTKENINFFKLIKIEGPFTKICAGFTHSLAVT